jgi:hypothetical protein
MVMAAAAVLVLGGVAAIIAVVAGSGGGGGGAAGPQATFDKFVSSLQTHNLTDYNATLCSDSPGTTQLTRAQLDQFTKASVVNEPNANNVGRISVTTNFAGNTETSMFDVTLADQSGWCVQNIVAAGGASTGSS